MQRAADALDEAMTTLINEYTLGAGEAANLLKEAMYRIEQVLGEPPPTMELTGGPTSA